PYTTLFRSHALTGLGGDGGELRRGIAQHDDRRTQVREHGAKSVQHAIKGDGHATDFVFTIDSCTTTEVVGGLHFQHGVFKLIDGCGEVAHQDQRDRHASHQKQGRDDSQLGNFLANHRLHVVEINAGTDDPSPGLIAFDIGEFGNRFFYAWLGPVVFHKALLLGAYDSDGRNKEMIAGGVFKATHVLAIQLGLVGVHHHTWMHIVDPEVF